MKEDIIEQRTKFYETLFDSHEPIAFGKDDSTANKPTLNRESFVMGDAEKFCINPVWDWRVTENICVTSLLFECDDETITPKDQAKLFFKSGLPFTTMVASGGKSIHVILRFTMPFSTEKKWSLAWWEAISRVLLQYGIATDKRAALVTQLSRVPGTIREKTGKPQTLITIRNRVSHSEVLQWLRAHGENVIPPPEPKQYEPIEWNNDMSIQKKWEVANKWTMRKNDGTTFTPSNPSGNWCWLFDFGVNCHNIGLSLEHSIVISETEWGVRSGGTNGEFAIRDAITSGYEWVKNKN